MSNKKTIQGSVGTSVPDGWYETTLKGVSNVSFSNVDKKTHEGEIPVRLCNYMDVYRNDYIRDGISFMEASATKSELRRFSVKKGDVIITKDSETPNDIGIPTAILEDIENLVCGYHLALIQPDADKVESVVLSKLIGSNRVSRYYARQANGLTRYGLSTQSINDTPLVLPKSMDEQKAIGNVLFSIDKAIEQTEAIVAKYERIKQGLMQDLLTKGIDENGNIRNEKSHKFKNSPLGRIPAEWVVRPLNRVGTLISGGTPSTGQSKYWNGNVIWLTPDDLSDGRKYVCSSGRKITHLGLKYSSAKMIPARSIIISSRAPIGYLAIVQTPYTTNQGCKSLVPNIDENCEFHYYNLQTAISRMIALGSGTTFTEISKTQLESVLVTCPSPAEQERIAVKLAAADRSLVQEKVMLKKFNSLKRGLMQDLLTGKVRVTHLMQKV